MKREGTKIEAIQQGGSRYRVTFRDPNVSLLFDKEDVEDYGKFCSAVRTRLGVDYCHRGVEYRPSLWAELIELFVAYEQTAGGKPWASSLMFLCLS